MTSLRSISLTLLITLGLSSDALASPWLLREDEVVISGRFDLQEATQEFLDEGGAVPYSLRGQYRSATFEIQTRFGLLDNVELQLDLPLRVANYTADPVILVPAPAGQEGLDHYQDNILNFSHGIAGIADLRMAARFGLWTGRSASSFELSLKTPTGYDPPSGTFGDQPKTIAEFEAQVADLARPENIADDLTLGDGQVDLGAKWLLGWALPTRTFIRLDAGYLLRLSGAGDQAIGDLRIGQAIGRRVLLSAGGRLAYTVQSGDILGVSVAADDPTLPANEYEGTNNLKLREVPLDHDLLTLGAGAIVRITPSVEANIAYEHAVWGRNTAAVQTVSLGLGVRFDAGGDGR